MAALQAWASTLTSTKCMLCTFQKFWHMCHSENRLWSLGNQVQTFGHIFASCYVSLTEGRYAWRHKSVLQITSSLLTRCCSNLVVDLPSFISSCITTDEQERPDMVIGQQEAVVLLEFTLGFETNVKLNSKMKHEKCTALVDDVVCANFSMGACCGFLKRTAIQRHDKP